ncbi:MAG TPA: winged helix-turn-helix domain-containing protein [Candidatus Sulfotelmatobacter sp.]|nr:winged helix-turn-helix domain-containing protein [Candidatus Sulfotelmatobacter sp.]
MSSRPQSCPKVRFGEFELDVQTGELRSNGTKAVLPGKPFQILVTLLSRPGQLIPREELKRQLWPSDTFVDFDVSLNKAVNRLREALGDSAENPRFIETLPRKGYRFIGVIGNGASPTVTESAVLQATDNHGTADKYVAQATTNHAGQRIPLRLTSSKHILRGAITLLILAIVVVAIFKWLKPRHPDLSRAQITKLTDSGRAHDVAISQDGRYVVYALRGGEEESLRLRHTATQSDVEILPSGPGFHGLTFSPDGNYIYVIRSDPKDPYFKYLYSVPALGGSARRMIADVDSPVTFSPDGQQFAFERAVLARNVIELRLANADGTGEHVLATIPNGDAGLFQPGPSWSRDGKTIVCPFRIHEKEIRWVLASVSVPNGEVGEIYSDSAALGRPVWLSEENILVPRYDSAYGRWQLWTMSYPDGKARRFTNDLVDYDQPLDISRDENTVVAVASSVISNIWEAPADNPSRAKQITIGGPPMIDVAETVAGQLLSSDGDGKVWQVVTNGKREAFSDLSGVRWLTTCGSLILFTSFEANAATLTRADGDGMHLMRLFSGDLAYPGCSPDGKFVYYVNRHRPQKLWKVSTDGGSPLEIGTGMGEGVTGWLDVSPDGKMLAYPFDQYRPVAWKIAVIRASGGPATKIFDVPGGANRVRWSPAGVSLQYLVTQNGATNLWEQPLAGGKPKQLTKFTSGRILDFNWSSDHRRLLLTRGDVTSDVVMLSNLR